MDFRTKQTFAFEVCNVSEFSKIKQADVRAYGQAYVEDTQHGDQQDWCENRAL